eukprot:158128-Amphidinium_carterae.1
MRALGVKDAESKVQKMCDIVEFCTGEQRTLPLIGPLRTWSGLLQHLKESAGVRHRTWVSACRQIGRTR